MEEDKLLGHIVSKDGIKIDWERLKAINLIPQPKIVRDVQSFGQINFWRRFVPNFIEKTMTISNMMKKDRQPLWFMNKLKHLRELEKSSKKHYFC